MCKSFFKEYSHMYLCNLFLVFIISLPFYYNKRKPWKEKNHRATTLKQIVNYKLSH